MNSTGIPCIARRAHGNSGVQSLRALVITRLRWDGPWLRPGVPPSVAYRHTHWVASAPDRHGFPDAFDCNWGWQGFGELFGNMRSLALETPGATGAWWPTHIYEIALPAAAVQTG